MTVDLAVVGGGVAGATLGAAVAQRGGKVLVLERETKFKDRVRGENMLPWGVATARRLGVLDDLVAAGGHACRSSTCTRWARRSTTGRCRRRRRRAKPASTCTTRTCRRRCSPGDEGRSRGEARRDRAGHLREGRPMDRHIRRRRPVPIGHRAPAWSARTAASPRCASGAASP